MLYPWIIQNVIFRDRFSHWAWFPGEPSQLLPGSLACSFLLVSSIPQYGCITGCLAIRPLKDTYSNASFWLLQINDCQHEWTGS